MKKRSYVTALVTALVEAIVCLALVGVAGTVAASAQSTNAGARAAVESWIALLDSERYGETWDAAASFFKNAVPRQKWIEAAQGARRPLGLLTSRTAKSSTSTATLPGAPDGEYVVAQFNTVFEKKAAALETITVVREPDGQWRVVGYFVR